VLWVAFSSIQVHRVRHWIDSRPDYWLSWPRIFVIFLSFSGECSVLSPNRPYCLLQNCFNIFFIKLNKNRVQYFTGPWIVHYFLVICVLGCIACVHYHVSLLIIL
jgi:hypothetical protein